MSAAVNAIRAAITSERDYQSRIGAEIRAKESQMESLKQGIEHDNERLKMAAENIEQMNLSVDRLQASESFSQR